MNTFNKRREVKVFRMLDGCMAYEVYGVVYGFSHTEPQRTTARQCLTLPSFSFHPLKGRLREDLDFIATFLFDDEHP